MTSHENAVAAILRNVNILQPEQKLLSKCIRQVAAEDIYSDLDLPQAEVCGPDGYAVRSADIQVATKDTPVTLRIGETVRAGYLPKRSVETGTAFRVMTGSVFPRGADCVVRFEDTDEPPDKSGPNQNNPSCVKIFVALSAGTNLRPAGSTVRRGALVVPKGAVIGPAQVSALSAIGKTSISVIRRPVIAVIATGDELVPAGKPLMPGKSYNSNTAAIASLITHYGGIPRILGIARDNEASLLKKITQGIAADAIITSGGVSKGDFDLVRKVIGTVGEIVFAKIQMGPGASASFGLVNRSTGNDEQTSTPVFALAGPPAGCLINFETLVRPGLLKMMGYADLAHPTVEAQSVDSVCMKIPFAFVKWTRLEDTANGYQVQLNSTESTGFLSSMATANSLTIIQHGSKINPGDKVQVWPLNWS
jgi:molybdopterin molybdotransferase